MSGLMGKGAARLKRSGASRTAGMRAYAPVRRIFHASYLRCPAADAMSGAARRAPGRTILNGVIQGDVNTIPSPRKRVPTPRTLMRRSCGEFIRRRRRLVLSRGRADSADGFDRLSCNDVRIAVSHSARLEGAILAAVSEEKVAPEMCSTYVSTNGQIVKCLLCSPNRDLITQYVNFAS